MVQPTAAGNYAGVWDNRLGFGQKTALLVIDLLQGYTIKGVQKLLKDVGKNQVLKGAGTSQVFIQNPVLEAPHENEKKPAVMAAAAPLPWIAGMVVKARSQTLGTVVKVAL